jgi:hypothetical protein
MSVVIFHRGIIAADSRAIIDRGYHTEDVGSMLKLWSNESKDMVFGICGENVANIQRAYWMEEFEPLVRALDVDELKVSLPLPETLQKRFGMEGVNSLNIMTKRELYTASGESLYKVDDSHETHGYGNGLRIAKLACYNGYNAIQAVELACQISVECALPVRSYRQKDLVLIRKPRGKKNA